jgi:type II secretory pathway pseudopilin PulG
VLLFMLVIMSLFMIVIAIVIDGSRMFTARGELQTAADNVVRHAAHQLRHSTSAARTAANNALSDNAILDGTLDGNGGTITFGKWDPFSKTFTPLADNDPAVDSVRYVASHSVDVFFANALGVSSFNLPVESIARAHRQLDELDISARCNPWLAGDPLGTVANPINPHKNPDHVGKVGQSGSPLGYTLPLQPGSALSFDTIDGGAAWGHSADNSKLNPGDGHASKWTWNRYATGKVPDANNDGLPDVYNPYQPGGGSENGKADIIAPYVSVIAVFLGPNQADPSSVPAALDFRTKASRDFKEINPKIAQPFFIGDGRDDDGRTQKFVVPPGATRLFIGVMDGYEWGNNTGSFKTIVKEFGSVSIVR